MTSARPADSPRSDAEPMAFTADEFLRGAVAAWLWFNVLFGATLTIAQLLTQSTGWDSWGSFVVVLMYAVPIALVVSGLVTLVCCGAAWGLGRLLRRHRSFVLHAACYAMLGAAIGVLVITVYVVAVQAPWDLTGWLAIIVQGCSAAAVPLGWGWTVLRSIRIEAGRARVRTRPDEAFEDGL